MDIWDELLRALVARGRLDVADAIVAIVDDLALSGSSQSAPAHPQAAD